MDFARHECDEEDANIVIRHANRGERAAAGTAAIVQAARQQMLRAEMSMVERASVLQGATTTRRARSVNRSNIQMPAYDHIPRRTEPDGSCPFVRNQGGCVSWVIHHPHVFGLSELAGSFAGTSVFNFSEAHPSRSMGR